MRERSTRSPAMKVVLPMLTGVGVGFSLHAGKSIITGQGATPTQAVAAGAAGAALTAFSSDESAANITKVAVGAGIALAAVAVVVKMFRKSDAPVPPVLPDSGQKPVQTPSQTPAPASALPPL